MPEFDVPKMWSKVWMIFFSIDCWLVNPALVHKYNALDRTRTQHRQNNTKGTLWWKKLFSNSRKQTEAVHLQSSLIN